MQSNNLVNNNTERSKLICRIIEKLRHKLLDTTRKNPLISTKLSGRLNSLIRIVDEVPESLFKAISSDAMRIVSLPDLENDLKDENTREFQNSLVEARFKNAVYLSELEAINQVSDDAANFLVKAERKLKNNVRENLGMPQRQTKSNLSLEQHAKNHSIFPSFELQIEEKKHKGTHYIKKNIQTLLLPDMMERQLNAIHDKGRTWQEETGISVLHTAFGFLEWKDGNNSSTQFSPLLLMPVQLTKKNSKVGQEFWVTSDDVELEENKTLAEKLRLEFSIILPEYTGQGIENYLKEVSKQKPKNMSWKIRRWVVIGVFPSARLAMYSDLSPENWDFASHPIISSLFGGSDTGHDAAPFGDEYNIDEPKIESKVPYLIADADSSQFSTIVDIANGKNLAVEGPPGTGKSQTIINVIAASLASGKKVLFVAEKSAALEIVKSRLEAFDLGDFVLPLQANRSSKGQVISSIRNRIEMSPCSDPLELDQELQKFKEARDKLKGYIDTLATVFAKTNFSVHSILGKSIKLSNIVDDLPDDIKKYVIPNITTLSSDKLQEIIAKCEKVEKAWDNVESYPEFWKTIQVLNIDPFKANEILQIASEAGVLYQTVAKLQSNLTTYKLDNNLKPESLKKIKEIVDQITEDLSKKNINFVKKLTTFQQVEKVKCYLNNVDAWHNAKIAITEHVTSELNQKTLESLVSIKAISKKHALKSLKKNDLMTVSKKNKDLFDDTKKVVQIFEQMLKINADIFAHLLVFDLIRIIDILFPVSKQVLLLRDKKLDDASLQLILIKQIAKTHALKEQRNFLSKEFILSSLPSYKIISNHAKILSQAGVFSIMSKDYRNAKNFYKSINKSKVFKKDYAAKKLRQISEWIDGVKDFSENEGIREILGVHYNSVDTDFTPFKEVIQLFKDADECFAGMDYIELRKFIKYGDIDQIQSLPKLSNDHSIRKFPNLTLDNMSKETNILKECEEDITKLQNLICVLKIPEDEDFDKSLIDELPIELEKLLEALKYLNNNDDIKNIFGHAFKVEKTTSNDVRKSLKLALNLTKLDSVECAAFIHCAQSDLLADLKSLIIEILQCRTEAYSSIKQLANLTVTKPEKWVNDKSLSEVSKFMKLASKDRDGLICYSRLLATKNDLTTDGYNGFVDLMLANKRYNLCESIEALIMRAMARATYEVYGGTLSSYNGSNLALYRKRLQESDRKVIKLSRQRVQSQLYHNATPPVGNGNGKKSDFTDLALLKHEISKKRQHISIRSLTKKAASALSELKPCWMMSPLAVAQYIPKDGFEFDLLIIDEASQMTPEDAIGAIIRSKQVMVVGDTNQLPPTTFFRKGSDDEESEEDEKVTEESILEIANTRFKPSRRLRWHYRSRDASLIAFSNKYIYNDNLVVFPSAQENHPSMGVEYIEVNGIYSASTNLEEAKVMVNATMNFIKKYPEKSLGIVLMNKKQRDLLDEEMNLMLTNNNDIRMYKRRWEEKNKGLESFFIKNLENVQGDERDVIFIGTVYGPEKKDAPVMQRFGPIAGINGKRRLNVLFSRAKERIVTFSSMTASDIRAEEGGNPGAYLLGRWLEYSASKILHSGEYLEKEPDSAFEEHVIQQIKSIGCEAIPQVGVKGFAIDIGVKHTDWKHGFIMGVECDGAAYHSSVSARDRDRLRQEVLEGLGWSLYRIWSTDWFEDPRRETEKLRNAITERLRELQSPS